MINGDGFEAPFKAIGIFILVGSATVAVTLATGLFYLGRFLWGLVS